MISIIVPVYRVESFLPRCIDSILSQTYKDLEIILVDDGSPDHSGEICDSYAEKDERIHVIHQPNAGVSSARNAGIRASKGEYIGFIDSDDWAEPDMVFRLHSKAIASGADLVECGYYRDFPGRVETWHCKKREYRSGEILNKFIEREIDAVLWNKLFSRRLFDGVVFPEGRTHEDDAVMCQLLHKAQLFTAVETPEYHWWQREGSLSNAHDMKDLVDYWKALYDQWMYCKDLVDQDHQQMLLEHCAMAISRTWAWYYALPGEERARERETTRQMTAFSQEHFPALGFPNWNKPLRMGVFFSKYNNAFSFLMAYCVNQAKRTITGRRLHKDPAK